MKTFLAASAVTLPLVAVGAVAQGRVDEVPHAPVTTAVRPAAAAFRPAPIRPDWIIAGDPVAEIADIARTRDEAAQAFLWRTSAGTFRWIHAADEIVTIIQGDVVVTDADGRRHHLVVGDVAHFPAGAEQVWEVPVGLVKSAILKPHSPRLVETPLRWLRRALSFLAG